MSDAPGNPILQLERFGFAFGQTPVLRDIVFSLEPGAYLSIVGPNGAGKSTLLKSLLRLHEHGKSSGVIRIGGREIGQYGQRELARSLSYVPQAGGWIPPFSVEEFLRLSRYPHSSGASLKKADLEPLRRALALTGLEDMAGRGLGTLSGGERQRAFLAAALAQDTKMMLLDEPASFLDPKHAFDLNRLLARLNREQGLTMLTVTHDLNHPLSVGGQVLVLRRGEQLFFGPARELLGRGVLEQAYEHEFTYFTHPRSGRPAVLAD